MAIKLEIKGNFLHITDPSTNEVERVIKSCTTYDFIKGDKILTIRSEQGTNQVSYQYNIFALDGTTVIIEDSTDTPFVSLAALGDFLDSNLGGAVTEFEQDQIINSLGTIDINTNESGDYEQELRTTARTFAAGEIKELSFEVVSGTVDVTIGGNLITYPLSNGTTGLNDLKDNTGLGEIIITPVASTRSSILLVYKLV
mgnify:CR=1 FL=1